MKTRPQVMPAVTSLINVTVALTVADVDGLLDEATVRALSATLSTVNPDLEWRSAYATDGQLDETATAWKGRRPADGDEEAFLEMLVIDDQIGPAMAREVDAQFAKDPEWDAVRGPDKIDETDELVTFMADWHAEANLTGAAKDAARYRWWAGGMVGRVYVPEEYQKRLQGGNPPTTLQDALELVHVQAVDPREGGPVRDRHGRTLGYFYRYQRDVPGGEAQRIVEVHTPRHVLIFRDQEGKLVRDPDGDADNPFHDPARPGRTRRAEYLMWHAERDGGSSITTSVRHAQERLNVVTTYHGRNDDQTGYRQIVVGNAEQPKNKKGEHVPFPMGPGVALNVRGLLMKKKSAQGLSGESSEERHTPSFEVIEPLDPMIFHIPSADRWKRNLLEKLDQLWTLNPETQVSGESKRQSRKPFDRRVGFAAQDMGAFVAWALRAALMLAAQILKKTRDYQDVTFQPKLFLDVDAANLEELRVKLAMWQQGALTLVSLLEATPGVPDAAKEAEKVAKEAPLGTDAQARQAAIDRLTGPPADGGNP